MQRYQLTLLTNFPEIKLPIAVGFNRRYNENAGVGFSQTGVMLG
jgi:hypothetical protein